MKKIFGVLFITLLIFILGCGSSNLVTTTTTTTTTSTTSTTAASTTTTTTSTTTSTTIDINLVAYWAFNESSGTTASDSSQNNHSGTVIGGTWTTGKSGNALHFDGTDDYVRIPGTGQDAPSEIANLTQGTIAFWFKFDDAAGGSGIFFPAFYIGPSPGTATTNAGLIIEIGHKGIWNDSSELFYTVTSANIGSNPALCFDSGTNLTAGQWYHFAVVVSSTGNTGYLNGTEMTGREYNFADSSSTYFLSSMTGGILSIGYGRSAIDSTFYYFKGTIDEVRIYNKALSASEVQELAQ